MSYDLLWHHSSIIFYVLQLENDRTYTFSLIKNMDSSRGYPVSFVKQPPSEIPAECPICFEILCQPKVVSCCGHSFCAVCIGRVASSHKPCPLCGQEFTLTVNKWLERILNGYDVHCPHQEKGCKWTGELGQLQHHLNQNSLATWQAAQGMSVSRYSVHALSIIVSKWTSVNGRPRFEWLSNSWHWMWV